MAWSCGLSGLVLRRAGRWLRRSGGELLCACCLSPWIDVLGIINALGSHYYAEDEYLMSWRSFFFVPVGVKGDETVVLRNVWRD